MASRSRQRKLSRSPVQEHDYQRLPDLGYEPEGSFGYVRCLEHGAPNPLIRWHYHEEYELHLIIATSGKVFVGDYIGQFQPGHLVLTGPRLPHNWISTEIPHGGVNVRDRVLQFSDAPLRQAGQLLPELQEAWGLLERARHGIEFKGLSDLANERITRIQESSGLRRFSEFLALLSELSTHEDYKLLSGAQLQSFENDDTLLQVSEIIDFITANYDSPFTMREIAERFSMNESQFSRYFRRATGNTFTDFVNRLRISRACQLLMETDQYINTICYNVGFNNVANFNRRFLQIKGVTPSEFRQQGKARYGDDESGKEAVRL